MADTAEVLAGKSINGRADAGLHAALPPTRFSKSMFMLMSRVKSLKTQGGGTIGAFERKVSPVDYKQSLVRSPKTYAAGLTDYFTITLLGRGADGGDFVRKPLINPDSVSVSYDMRDAESNARGGYQVGAWGEIGTVTLSGWTAGRYFAGRLIDEGYAPYAAAYRDMQEMIAVYENNGNWFEGEEAAGSNVLPLDSSRKQIKLHANVHLKLGNFIWEGYFTQMKLDEDAQKPWNAKFTLTFQVLRESYVSTSPWRNSIAATVRFRGHAYELYANAIKQKAADRSNEARLAATIQNSLGTKTSSPTSLLAANGAAMANGGLLTSSATSYPAIFTAAPSWTTPTK